VDDRNWGPGWSDQRHGPTPVGPSVGVDPRTGRTGERPLPSWEQPGEVRRPEVETGSDDSTGRRAPALDWSPPPRHAAPDAGRAVPRQRVEPGWSAGALEPRGHGPRTAAEAADAWNRPVTRQHAVVPMDAPAPPAPRRAARNEPVSPGPRHGLRPTEAATDRDPVRFRKLPDPPRRGSHGPGPEEQGYGPVLVWVFVWIALPLLSYTAWAFSLGSTPDPHCQTDLGAPCAAPRVEALHTLAQDLPLVGLALAIAAMVAMTIRRISDAWRPYVVAFAGSVIGAAVVTAVASAIGGPGGS
jgi:hypothetical protein